MNIKDLRKKNFQLCLTCVGVTGCALLRELVKCEGMRLTQCLAWRYLAV